jgi:hypothetical protein
MAVMRLNYVKTAQGSTKNPWRDPKCMKCSNVIHKGDPYQWIQGFRGPKKIICGTCVFTRSDMTNSKLAQVYDAFDDAYKQLDDADEGTDLQSILDEVTQAVREVEDEYRSAADEYFNGGGPSAESADECDSCASELESIDVPELHDFDKWEENELGDDSELDDDEKHTAWSEWIQEQIGEFRSNIENADSL